MLTSCKTSGSFSIHHRKYNPGYYFEHASAPNNGNLQRKKALKEKESTDLEPGFKCFNAEPAASNAIVKLNIPAKTVKTIKTSFLKSQNGHCVEEMTKKPKNQVQKSNLGSIQFKENREKRQGSAFAKAFMYAALYLAFGLILYGIGFLVFAGGSPQGLLLGISLILIGLIILGLAAAMSSIGGRV